MTLVDHELSSSLVLSEVRVALSLVLYIVLFLQAFPVVDSLMQAFCDNIIENLLV